MRKLLLSALFLVGIIFWTARTASAADPIYPDRAGSGYKITVTTSLSSLTRAAAKEKGQITFTLTSKPEGFFVGGIPEGVTGNECRMGLNSKYAYEITQGVGGVTKEVQRDWGEVKDGKLIINFKRDFDESTIGPWILRVGYGYQNCQVFCTGCRATILPDGGILSHPFTILETEEGFTEPRVCVNTPVENNQPIAVKVENTAPNTKYTVWVDGKIKGGSTVLSSENPSGTLEGWDHEGPNKICMRLGEGGSGTECSLTYNVDFTIGKSVAPDTVQSVCSTQEIFKGFVGLQFGPQSDISKLVYCNAEKTAISTAIGCIPIGNTNNFVAWVLRWALGIAGGVAFLFMLYAGFTIMTASGNPDRLQHGRELLTAAISGLILIIFSVFLLRLIGVEILNLPGFGISQ